MRCARLVCVQSQTRTLVLVLQCISSQEDHHQGLYIRCDARDAGRRRRCVPFSSFRRGSLYICFSRVENPCIIFICTKYTKLCVCVCVPLCMSMMLESIAYYPQLSSSRRILVRDFDPLDQLKIHVFALHVRVCLVVCGLSRIKGFCNTHTHTYEYRANPQNVHQSIMMRHLRRRMCKHFIHFVHSMLSKKKTAAKLRQANFALSSAQ